jgi:hypothetical protein
MEYDQRVIIRFLFNEKVSADEIQRRLTAQFGEDSYSIRSVRRWCQYLRQGRKDLHDEQRPGRPPLDNIDAKILALLTAYPFHSAYSLADSIGISQQCVLNHLHDSLGLQNFQLRWIPHELTELLRDERVEFCQRMLPVLERRGKDNFHYLVTGDESWFFLEYQHSHQWCRTKDEVATRVSQKNSDGKYMLTVFWGPDGFQVINLMPSGRTFNTEYFLKNVMEPLVQKTFPNDRTSGETRLHVHLDNCTVHESNRSHDFFTQNELVRVPHPLYSPDLSPSDF